MTNNLIDLASALATLCRSDQAALNNLLLVFAATDNLPAINAPLKAGALPDAKDSDGWTPLHYAALNGHTATAEALIARGAATDAKDNAGQTPLHYAAHNGHTATVEALITRGALPDAKSKTSQTPLHYAARYEGSQSGPARDGLVLHGNVITLTRGTWLDLGQVKNPL